MRDHELPTNVKTNQHYQQNDTFFSSFNCPKETVAKEKDTIAPAHRISNGPTEELHKHENDQNL